MLKRQLDVVRRHDALQQERQLGLAPQPRDILPAQRRINKAAHDPPQPAALLVVLGLVVDHRTTEAFVRAHPLVRLALPGRRGVDRHVDRFDVRCVGVELGEQGLRFAPLAVDVELEEERVFGGSGGDVEGGVGGVGADALDDALCGAGAGHGELAVRVDEAGHGGGGDDQREADRVVEDVGAGGDVCHVAHDAGAEPDAAVEGLVRVAGHEAGVGGGVEGPCFGGGSVAGSELEVFGVDEGFEGWLFRGASGGGFGSGVFEGRGPFGCDCGGVEDAFEGVGGEAFFDDGGGMDGGVGVCGIAAGVFVYYCMVWSASSTRRWEGGECEVLTA